MGRFDEKFSEAQRAAVGTYLLEPDPVTGKRRTARQAVEALQRGELNAPAPPDPMPLSTAYWCKDREKQRRNGNGLSPLARQVLADPELVQRTVLQTTLSAWEKYALKLEEAQAKGKVDPRLFGLVVKHASAVMALTKASHSRTKPSTRPERATEAPESAGPDDIANLIHAHNQSARGTSTPTPNVLATDSAAR